MSCATAPAPDELAVLRARVSEQAAEIAHLKLVIAKLRRMQFGRSSEQMDQMLGQLELSLEELNITRAEREGLLMTRRRTSASAPPRKPLPEHLPRRHARAPACAVRVPRCGGQITKLGETVSDAEYVPASFRVIRHVRPKFACTQCDTTVQALAPSRPIARGLAGVCRAMLVAKYCDHLPLYRQMASTPARSRSNA